MLLEKVKLLTARERLLFFDFTTDILSCIIGFTMGGILYLWLK